MTSLLSFSRDSNVFLQITGEKKWREKQKPEKGQGLVTDFRARTGSHLLLKKIK